VLCKIVLENSFFLTKIWAHRIFCFNIVIGVIIWERSNLLGKQGMISCTWMKHGLTKITAQIICGFRMIGLMPQKYPRVKANVWLFCNSLCTELSSLLCIQSSWWYIKGMINGHQGKMLHILYMYILIYWWNRLIFMTHLIFKVYLTCILVLKITARAG
jgi:hypothetical protein